MIKGTRVYSFMALLQVFANTAVSEGERAKHNNLNLNAVLVSFKVYEPEASSDIVYQS